MDLVTGLLPVSEVYSCRHVEVPVDGERYGVLPTFPREISVPGPGP